MSKKEEIDKEKLRSILREPLTEEEVREIAPAVEKVIEQAPPKILQKELPPPQRAETITQAIIQEMERGKEIKKDELAELVKDGRVRLEQMVLEEILERAGFGRIRIPDKYYRKKLSKKVQKEFTGIIWSVGFGICGDKADLLQKQKEGKLYKELSGPESIEAQARWSRYLYIIIAKANEKKLEPAFRAAILAAISGSDVLKDYIGKHFKKEVLSFPELFKLLKR